MNNEAKAYISIKEAVRLTGISEFSIRRMITGHEIAFISCGNKYLINRAKLFEHLEAASLSNQRR